MPNQLMRYTCCLFVLTSCLGREDSRWKRKDKENLRHDIDLFKELAEKIEDEIDSFYEDYPEKQIEIRTEHSQETHKETVDHGIGKLIQDDDTNIKITSQELSANDISQATHAEVEKKSRNNIETSTSINNSSIRIFDDLNYETEKPKVKFVNSNSNWPKFDDIVLAIGKKYDWDNDRWVKVRRKEKDSRNNEVAEASKRIEFMKIHKFSYSMVKLNKSKSRRNIIIAVSAIR